MLLASTASLKKMSNLGAKKTGVLMSMAFTVSNKIKQGYRYNKFRKPFSKFYYRNLPHISKYKYYLKILLRQDMYHL